MQIKTTLNEPLASKTTFKIGGTAPIFISPKNMEETIFVLQTLCSKNMDFFVLAGGSNIVISDEGFNCPVISLSDFCTINHKNNDNSQSQDKPKKNVALSEVKTSLICDAGCSVSSITNYCKKNCISEFEQFAGLPGTIGGAVFMNARCFEKQISDILKSVTYFDTQDLQIKKYELTDENKKTDWDYKKTPFQYDFEKEQHSKKIILQVELNLTLQNEQKKDEINENCKKYIDERVNKGHFQFPSAGSVFKNNHDFGKPSGKIIDECGLKGMQIGGAQIAPFHGNFIINIQNATQKDVKNLVNFTVKKVSDKFGFNLTPEIIFCGI